MKKSIIIAPLVLFLYVVFANGHVNNTGSIHDITADILKRLSQTVSIETINKLSSDNIHTYLTDQELELLSTEYITFSANQNVTVYIAVNYRNQTPFWLQKTGFRLTGEKIKTNDGEYNLWEKKFNKGRINLGINSVRGGGRHYAVFIKSDKIFKVDKIYPGQHKLAKTEKNTSIYVDRATLLDSFPEILNDSYIFQTIYANKDAARLTNIYTVTEYPSQKQPDHIILSWTKDPRTTQTVSWRTDTTITSGYLYYQKKSLFYNFNPEKPQKANSTIEKISTNTVFNDKAIYRHFVTLENLEPNTTYVYSISDETGSYKSSLYEFTTAPDRTQPFSFLYMGDAQNGLERWGSLMKTAYRMRPDVSFILMAGDLVNRGAQRDDWDALFSNADQNFASASLMPAIGNHECQGGHPSLYLQLLHLPENAPKPIEKERVYSFEYSNALFISLDSNLDPASQAQWLDQTLTDSKATWKFVMFHHPIYSSSSNRDNPEHRSAWLPIFDKHHVDMVLQGHDHAYLRTYPMKDNKRVESTKEGTVYVVSVSGTKMYKQGDYDYIENGFTNTSTFQILDILVSGNKLIYKSYNDEGNIADHLIIEK